MAYLRGTPWSHDSWSVSAVEPYLRWLSLLIDSRRKVDSYRRFGNEKRPSATAENRSHIATLERIDSIHRHKIRPNPVSHAGLQHGGGAVSQRLGLTAIAGATIGKGYCPALTDVDMPTIWPSMHGVIFSGSSHNWPLQNSISNPYRLKGFLEVYF